MVLDYYGQNVEYTPDMVERKKIELIEKGSRARDIDKALTTLQGGVSYNYDPLAESYNWKQLGPNLLRNAKEFETGLRTFGGAILNSLGKSGLDIYNTTSPMVTEESNRIAKGKIADAFKRAVSKDSAKRLGKDIIGASIGTATGRLFPQALGVIPGAIGGLLTSEIGPRETLDAVLSPYNISTEDIVKLDVDPRDIVQGIMRNPLYVTADTLSVPGVSKGISKVSQVLPVQKEKAVSNLITESLGKTRSDLLDRYAGLNALNSMPLIDREKIVKAIVYNDFKGLNDKDILLANAIKSDISKATSTAVEEGFIPKSEAYDNIVAQYATMKNAEEFPFLTQHHVSEYMKGNPNINLPDKVVQDIYEGIDLADKDKIQYLSQLLAQSSDVTGNIKAKYLLEGADNYWNTKRIIGRTQPDKLGKVLESTLKTQFDQVYKAKEAKEVTKDVINNIGKEYKQGYELKPDEVFVSSKDIEDAIRNIYDTGNIKSLKNIGSSPEGKGYIIDRKDLNALYNALKHQRSSLTSRLLNIGKKNLLASPHWFIQNRVGNISNNIIEGVTAVDYNDAKKYLELMPKQLQSQTSFNAYIGSVLGEEDRIGRRDVWKQPVKEAITKAVRGKSNLEKLEGVNNILANSVFRAESNAETIDRYANMIRQAKRFAKDNNIKDWKDIIKQSDTDPETYRYLNLKVNKSLGDYVGKNYYVDPTVYDITRELIPFYRFYTQTGRTTWNQLKEHPLAFQSIIGLPTKAGINAQKSIEDREKLKYSNYKDYGGVPYYFNNGDYRSIGLEPLPLNAVLGTISDIAKGDPSANITNPFLTGYSNIMNMTNMGRPVITKGLIEAKKQGADKDYQYSLPERGSVAADTILQLLFYPYRVNKTWGRDFYSTVFGLPEQSLTNELGLYENQASYVKTEPYEKFGRQLGIQTMPILRERNKSIRQKLREKKRGVRYSNKIYSKKLQRERISK